MAALVAQLRHHWRREFRFGLSAWAVGAALLAILLGMPLALIAARAWAEPAHWSHLMATVMKIYARDTAILVLGAALLSGVLGVSTAWLVTACRFPGSRIFSWGLVLPLALPTYVAAYAYAPVMDFSAKLQALTRQHWGAEWQAIVEAVLRYGLGVSLFALVLYPYVFLLARSSFLRQTGSMIEASQVAGRGPWSTFWRVAFPLARPAIAGGLCLVIMETLNDYGAVKFLGIQTFTYGIFQAWGGLDDLDSAMRLAACLLGFMLLLITLERLQRGRGGFECRPCDVRPLRPYPLRGWSALAAAALCLLPIALGFLWPVKQLISWTLESSAVAHDELWLNLRHSFFLSASGAAIIVLVAVFLAYAARLHQTSLMWATSKIALLGYAVPGAVVALGVRATLGPVDRWTGALVSGSVAALLFAYLVRFLAVSFQPTEAGLTRVCHHLDEASRSMGHSPLATLCRVNLPLLRAPLFSAALLVFIDVFKELPLTLVLRPFNFETLATVTYYHADDEGLVAKCGPSALLIAGAGVVAAFVLNAMMLSRSKR